jgi:hypothetical protein
MSHLHFIGGEKGGVGKSLVARILAQYFIDRRQSLTAFDADQSHGALLRFYSDYTTAVSVEQYESLDRIVDTALADPEAALLVDLAAQTQHALSRWMEESDLLAVAGELGITLTYWHVMDSGRDSVDLLRSLLDRFGGKLRIIIVKNEVRSNQFPILDASNQLQRAEQLGAQVISIRRLHETCMQKIDACSTSFWAAVNQAASAGGLGLLERQRVKVWLHHAYEELDRLGLLASPVEEALPLPLSPLVPGDTQHTGYIQ